MATWTPASAIIKKVLKDEQIERFIANELINADFVSNGLEDTEYIPNEETVPSAFLNVVKYSTAVKLRVVDVNSSGSSAGSVTTTSDSNDTKVNVIYAINSISKILEFYDKSCLTLSDTTNLLHTFISKDMLKVPHGIPSFLVQERENKLREFEAYYKIQGGTNNFCVYCKWLGITPYSHVLKDHRDVIYCPLYPSSNDALLKFDNLADTIVKIIEKMEGLKFCGHCKGQGLPREIFMSHIEKLSTGEMICPELRKSQKGGIYS